MSSLYTSIAKANSKLNRSRNKSNDRSVSAKVSPRKSATKMNKTLNSSSDNVRKNKDNGTSDEVDFLNGMKKIRDKLCNTLDAHVLVF